MKTATLADRVVELFKANPNRWIRERRIMAVGGYCGFRSRITDARRRGLDIINKTWRERCSDGITRTFSAYRYVPPSPPPAADLLEVIDRALAADSTTEVSL